MKNRPRFAKAHSQLVADEYVRLGWTLRKELREPEDDEPYEYLFEWCNEDEPQPLNLESEVVGVSEKEAIALALKVAENSDHIYPLDPVPTTVKKTEGGFGTKSLGMGQKYWEIVFAMHIPTGVVLSPEEVIVFVDELTGATCLFPSM
jgi:hypothetical protein